MRYNSQYEVISTLQKIASTGYVGGKVTVDATLIMDTYDMLVSLINKLESFEDSCYEIESEQGAESNE